MSMDLMARGLAAKTRADALKSAATQTLVGTIRANGGHPPLSGSLPTADVPTLTLGASGAASTITGAAANTPAVARGDARLTYVSGVPMLAGSVFPRTSFFTSRGGYYGAADASGSPLRATGYFAYEFQHAGTAFEVPAYGALGGAGVNFRVLVNGRAAATLAVPNTTGGLYYVKVAFPAAGSRRIRIETTGIPCNGVHVASSSEISRSARSYPLVTMIADSQLEGNGADVGDIQSIVLARALGLNPALAAVGGTGMIQPGANNTAGFPKVAWGDANRLTDLTLAGVVSAQDGSAADPALGLVYASINDQGIAAAMYAAFGATLQAAITNRTDALIDAWVAARPGRPLVLFGPIWPSGQPNNRPPLDIYRIRDGMAEAAWGRASDNVWFIERLLPGKRDGIYSTLTDQAALYTGSDGVHPTAAGHRFDGLADAALLRRLILTEFA